MLPRINVVVPTNEFYELNTDEARDLNDDGAGGGGDPIMGEDFQRNRGPNDAGATFRIRSYAADGVTPTYQYYIAQYLWEWARRGNRTDPRRNPWRYSDWMALRNQFEPTFPVPGWVRALESADLRAVPNGGNETWYWNDSYTPPRLVRVVNANGMTRHFSWNETAQRRYLHTITYAEPYDELLRGSTKRFAFYDQPDPAKQNYDADSNWSRLIAWHNPGKWTRHYAGPGSGGERLFRQTFLAFSELWHYGSRPGGGMGEEYLTEIKFLAPSRMAGQTWFYEGEVRHRERKVRVEHEYSEQVDFYEGLAGVEHKVETQYKDPSGNTISIFFEGTKNHEKVVKVVAWGQEHTPQPPQGQGSRLGIVHESAAPVDDDDEGVDTDNGDESESSNDDDDDDDGSYYWYHDRI